MASDNNKPKFYGVLAEFTSAQTLLEAVLRVKGEGYSSIDAFMPYPVEEISEEICNHKKSKVSKLVGIGALCGLATAFALQYWVSVHSYPLNIGGRPLNSWPAFVPVMFELTILFASFSAIGGMLFLNGLPRPYHPLFNIEKFERVMVDRFFLLIKSDDESYDHDNTRSFLEGLDSEEVINVDW